MTGEGHSEAIIGQGIALVCRLGERMRTKNGPRVLSGARRICRAARQYRQARQLSPFQQPDPRSNRLCWPAMASLHIAPRGSWSMSRQSVLVEVWHGRLRVCIACSFIRAERLSDAGNFGI
jgi:hypothetical protein